MKTLLQLTALATLIVALSFSMNASTSNFEPETYINDIPFNTEKIAAEHLYKKAVTVKFELEEENYIDDIPFNTECIAANCLYHKALKEEFVFDEESYVDDIPFSTEKIAMESLQEKAQNEEFTFTDEPYIDDIPAELLKFELKLQTLYRINSELYELFAKIK